jgi:transcriptional regulator with XRE-family HTH domain
MKKIKSLLKKYSLIVSLILVIGIIVGGHFWNKNMRLEIKKIEEEIKTKHSKVAQYEKDKENAPSPQLIAKLTREKEYLTRKFEFMMNNFSTTYPVIPEFTLYPAVEFKEFLYFSEDRLYKKAGKRRVRLPDSLPFPSTGLASEDEIVILTLQFEVVKDLITLVIDSGVTTIESISPGVPQKVAFYQVLPLKLKISGTSNEIVRFLKYIENPSSYFALRNFSVARAGGEFFSVDMDINAVMLKDYRAKSSEG